MNIVRCPYNDNVVSITMTNEGMRRIHGFLKTVNHPAIESLEFYMGQMLNKIDAQDDDEAADVMVGRADPFEMQQVVAEWQELEDDMEEPDELDEEEEDW